MIEPPMQARVRGVAKVHAGVHIAVEEIRRDGGARLLVVHRRERHFGRSLRHALAKETGEQAG